MISDKLKIIILSAIAFILFGAIVLVEIRLGLRLPEIFVEKPFVPANITVFPNRIIGPLPGIWRSFSQGGEEPGKRMLQPTVASMRRIKSYYIRLDHIFDDDYYAVVKGRKADNTLLLDWTRLDQTVADISAMGAKPMFSLSYMPRLIAGSKIGVPANWQDWQDLVKQTVEHYSKQFTDVYYEVWNEPSLPSFGQWRMYGEKDYRVLYEQSVLGASKAQEVYNYKIGGPAIPELDPRWIELLFDYVLQKNLRLDFISWHRYGLDPAVYLNDVYEINVLTEMPRYQKFKNTEKIITEWGPNSYKDTVYSSPVSASHAVAVLRQLLDKVNYAYAFEVKDGSGQGSYGWGLLTHESLGLREKPRFYLYEWLADLFGNRVELIGEGSQITGFAMRSDRLVTVILSNFMPGNAQEENFQAAFGELAGGKYRLLVQELFKEPKEQELDVSSNSIVLNINLPAYSVARLQLTKIAGLEPAESTSSALGNLTYEATKDRF